MDPAVPWLWTAGLCHLLIAVANGAAARVLNYRRELAGVTPIVREIFWVQNIYIELVLIAFALVCFYFPADLAGRTAVGLAISGFLAVFWGLRLLIQLVFYNPTSRRQHPVIDRLFVMVQAYLTGVFTVVLFRGLSC